MSSYWSTMLHPDAWSGNICDYPILVGDVGESTVYGQYGPNMCKVEWPGLISNSLNLKGTPIAWSIGWFPQIAISKMARPGFISQHSSDISVYAAWI